MKTPILCYHKVGPGSEEGRRLNIEPTRLESHVRFFARRQRRFALPREWPIGPPKSVIFSFDDAYESTLRYAIEVLERYGKVGAFYAVGGETTSAWDAPDDRPLASPNVLIRAAKAGHEIGNHTLHHPHLDQLDPMRQGAEIHENHRWLTDLGIQAESICYPYGGYNAQTVRIASELGYRCGLSLHKGLATSKSAPFRLPRVTVAYSDALPMLIYRVYVRAARKKPVLEV